MTSLIAEQEEAAAQAEAALRATQDVAAANLADFAAGKAAELAEAAAQLAGAQVHAKTCGENLKADSIAL